MQVTCYAQTPAFSLQITTSPRDPLVQAMLKPRPMCKPRTGLHQGHGHLGGLAHITPRFTAESAGQDRLLLGIRRRVAGGQCPLQCHGLRRERARWRFSSRASGNGRLPAEGKLTVAERCLQNFAVAGRIEADGLVDAGQRLIGWVEGRVPEAVWHVEVPVSAPREGGGQWSGAIDLLLSLPDDSVVILDHKSAPVRRQDCEVQALRFTGQLWAYREIMTRLGHAVRGMWIHFPLAGVMAELAP